MGEFLARWCRACAACAVFRSTNDNEEPDDEDKWHNLYDNDELEEDPEDEWYRQHECDDSDLLDDDGFEDRYGHY